MQTAAGQARATRPSPQGLPRACAEEPCLDAPAFAALAGVLDSSVLAGIYREFLAQTRSRLHQLSSGADRELRAALAHSIKGTAGMLGARSVASCAERLERVESEREAAVVLRAMAAACDRLDGELRERQVAS